MTRQRNRMQRISTAGTGQGLLEYSLLIGLVVMVSLGGLQLLGKNLSTGVQGTTDNFSVSMASSSSSVPSAPTTPMTSSTIPPGGSSTNNPPTTTTSSSNPSNPAIGSPLGQTTTSQPSTGQTAPGQPSTISQTAGSNGKEDLPITRTQVGTVIPPASSQANTTTTKTQSPPTTVKTSTTTTQTPTSDQSAWANSTNQCVGCTANMNGDWGW